MMNDMDLSLIARRVGALYRGPARPVAGVVIDSRQVSPGDLFVALSGTRADGHDYVDAAAERGAVAAIVEHKAEHKAERKVEQHKVEHQAEHKVEPEVEPKVEHKVEREGAPLPLLRVDSAPAALAELARANRAASSALVLGITGSCGKTSVKNMCRAIFSRAGPTVATAGNYNNELGLPLTLARLGDDTRFAVLEMGAAKPGDIAQLCALAKPRIATVLNALQAHLDGFGSVADVAAGKAEIFDSLGRDGVAVLNLDAPWAPLWRTRIAATGARVITWSLRGRADVSAARCADRGLRGTVHGTQFDLRVGERTRRVLLPLPGRHSVANALAAAALAAAAGLDPDLIGQGLEQVAPEAGRLCPETLADGTVLIDDSYNANPGSVRAAIEWLSRTPGSRALILGEMLELGRESAAWHARMGRLARQRGVDTFIGVGAALAPAVRAFGACATLYPDRDALLPALPSVLQTHDRILVKGSRGAAMESVLAALRAAAGGAPAAPEEAAPC